MCVDPMTAMMVASTVIGGVGQLQAAGAASASAKYNAQVADMNAKLANRAAKDALERGGLEEQKQRQQTAQLLGQQQAGMAANGVDLTFGSPLDLLVGTAVLGELDALTIRSNAYREERDIRQQGANYRGQAGMYRAEAKGAKTAGWLSAGGTVLGGGAQAYGNYQKTKIGSFG